MALDAALLARAANGLRACNGCARTSSPGSRTARRWRSSSRAALDSSGTIVSWQARILEQRPHPSPGTRQLPTLTAAAELAQPFELSPAVNPALPAGGADRNCIPLYEFADLRVVNNYVKEMPLRSLSLRSLGAFGNVFAIESFIDECAAAAGIDPIAFRLSHLKDARARAVIERLASRFSSFERKESRGRGIGFAKYKNLGAYCAVLAEVEVTHELRVRRLVAAVDVGLAVNPDGVLNQIEGGCVQAASWTLKEAYRPGVVGWEDYPILKFSEVPAVEVLLMKNTGNSGRCRRMRHGADRGRDRQRALRCARRAGAQPAAHA